MPVTHLQSLALRSVARASSAPTWSTAVRWLHGSRSTSTAQKRLFDQLFPDQTKQQASDAASRDPISTGILSSTDAHKPPPRWASQISDDLPPLAPSEELRRLSELPEPEDDDADFLSSNAPSDQPSSSFSSSSTTPPPAALRATTMLILNAASKSLLESDFTRIGAKGKHLRNWVNGIVKVIQGRDSDTLEPLGHYFILFDSHDAAVAYGEEVSRLRDLARKYTPGANHSHRHAVRRYGLPVALPTDTGEDVAALVKSFTLVPPSQRPKLQISKLNQERISKLDTGSGGLVDDISRAVGGYRHLVMVHVDGGGRMPTEMLRQAIRADGVERSLPWRVVSLKTGIIPFGKSVVRANDIEGDDKEMDWMTSSANPYSEDKNMSSAARAREEGHRQLEQRSKDEDGEQRQFPRFIVAFADEAEARRFIREWHRREIAPLPSAKEGGTDSGPASWDHPRIVNVSLLW